jgi:hypothetical protein
MALVDITVHYDGWAYISIYTMWLTSTVHWRARMHFPEAWGPNRAGPTPVVWVKI